MQERKKRRIVIASVLKPVNDTRMFEKLALTLAEDFEVHCIGYPSRSVASQHRVVLHPLPSFNRLSFLRFMVPWKIFPIIFRLRPAVLIVTTHELLILAVAARLLLGCKIIYDIQENYYRNIRFTNTYPPVLRSVLALFVRMKEWCTAPFMHHFFLAEKGYRSEFNFPRQGRTTLLENKFKGPTTSQKKDLSGEIRLLFSGTLAELTGVFVAIELAEKLHELHSGISLLIIGHCAHSETLQRIRKAIEGKDYVVLTGGEELVPHSEILHSIHQVHAGIVAYPIHPTTCNSVPTKLYEYLACELPILLIDYSPWVEVCKPYSAAVTFQPDNLNPREILNSLRSHSFYTAPPTGVSWEEEAPRLKAAIDCTLAG